MDARHILIDTSVLIDQLRRRDKRNGLLFKRLDNSLFYASTIVEFELFAGAKDAAKKRDAQNVMQLVTVLPFSSPIAQKAADIYLRLKQKNAVIEMRDIFIAATAIAHDLPLLTLNVKHFERMSDLRLESLE